MIIFPAVDIRRGNVVRLYKGLYTKETIYSRDPVAFAKKWKDEGAEFLHIVDMDGAFYGKSKNLPIIIDIVKKLNIEVQVGGGIRSREAIENLLNNGVSRVVMSTKVFQDEDFLPGLGKALLSRVVVSIDSKSGMVLDRGWTGLTNLTVAEAVKKVEDMGVKTAIITDASCDGTLTGPNIQLLEQILSTSRMNIIAAGGVSSIADVQNLAEISQTRKKLQGAIIGKALYEEKINLKEAIDCAK